MVETVDAGLVAQYRKMSVEGLNFRGLSLLQHEGIIGKLILRTHAETLLDYGSGWGDAYREPHELHKRWQVAAPTLYDPAIAPIAAKPAGVFDGVICSDVLEHIPQAHVDALIAELFAFAERFVFASVCCRPAKKCFADGRNMHVTVQPFEWWRARFERAAGEPGPIWHLKETA